MFSLTVEERPTIKLFNDKAAGVINAPTVWNNSLDGSGQVVGIADTGLDTGINDASMHLDFQGRIDNIFTLGNNSPADTQGHGTHVAGSVLGNGARSGGKYKGMAPGAHLVFQATGSDLNGIPYDLGQLFGQAYNAGARIHSDSWGGYSDGRYDAMARSVDNYIWNNDMTVLFAAVALVRQYYTSKLNIVPKPSLLKATLINGAVDMGYGFPSRDQGWGRIDLANSLFPQAPKEMKYINETVALTTGASQEYSYNVVSNSTPLKATLVWTDYPGSTAASKALVNDLDITVISPSGTVYKGNDFTAPYNDSVDRLNNVENVLIAAPEIGTYRFIVNAYTVPNGPQDFSLVVSGTFGSSSPQPEPQPQPQPDTTLPTVKLTAPVNGATVAGTLAVKSEATDNIGVSKVELLVDNVLKATDSAAPYEYQLDTKVLTNGQHQISVRAYDAAGNNAFATSTVTVNNQAQTTGSTTQTLQGSLASSASANYKDYYIDLTNTGEINLKLAWPGTAELDLYLYNPSGTQVANSAQLNNPETIKYNAPVTGRYRVRVYAYSGSADYTLTAVYPTGSGGGTQTPPPQAGTYNDTRAITTGTSVTYTVNLNAGGTMDVVLGWDTPGSDLDLYLYAPDGTLVKRAISSTANPETLSASVVLGSYKVKVTSYSGNANYNLKITYPQ